MIQRLASQFTRNLKQVGPILTGVRYTREFYSEQDATGRRSAEVVVPHLMEFVEPRSIVDVGCGSGSWLSVFLAHGVKDIVGIDSEAVPSDLLAVPASTLVRRDLRYPFILDRTFDLVVCLEAAEHIPSTAGEQLIASLTSLGPLVLFSAAIPHQGGTGHVNEQWPEYWAHFFRTHGYVAVDCMRRKVWNDPAVAWWYAQNMLLFANEVALTEWPKLRVELNRIGSSQLSLVHPRLYESRRHALRRVLKGS
jgi:SAM-dependent methyltransferase